MVSVTTVVPVLVAVKEAIFPEPLVGKPMVPSVPVQLYTTVPPVAVLLKVIAVV